uniref:tetratricopeptide repeat protein n=1 Tax=Streptomyces sp. NBC_01553 TaxID=2975877 RepID=UPI002F91678D
MEANAERAVAIGGNSYAPVLTGDHSRAVSLPLEALRPPAQVAAPAGLDNLAVQPGLFVGRRSELDRLDAALATPGGAVVQAVHGLGGIGKSTLAAHWAATRPHGHAPVRWITADTPAGVQQGLADLAGALQPGLTGALSIKEMEERALQWLASHTGWLLILDNVNEPADIAPLLARTHAQGRFLITSRLATVWHHIPTVVRLDVLDEADALDLLTRTATVTAPGRDLDGAPDLCAELGYLPLAIEQAAAYLAQNPLTTPRAYLALLGQYPAAMYSTGAVGITPPERTIARIWHLTLDRITTLQPQAAGLLRLLAWYAPDQIPATVLDGFADPPTLNASVGLLTAYSMVTPDHATNTLAVHRLVQALARTPDPNDPHRTPELVDQARTHATTQLDTALPATWAPSVVHRLVQALARTPDHAPANTQLDTSATERWRTLLPHIDTLVDHAPADTDTDTTAHLLSVTGLFLKSQCKVGAIGHLERALAVRVRVLGEDHPNTLACRDSLAYVCEAEKDVLRAIQLHEQTLAVRVRVLGEDHPDTLSSLGNLAYLYEYDWVDDLCRVIQLRGRILAARVRVLGEDHPDTLYSLAELAYFYRLVGDLGRAISLYEQALAGRVRVLGEDHPDTLYSLAHLAYTYDLAGDLGRAIPLYEQALAAQVRVGGHHSTDALVRGGLARAVAKRDGGET